LSRHDAIPRIAEIDQPPDQNRTRRATRQPDLSRFHRQNAVGKTETLPALPERHARTPGKIDRQPAARRTARRRNPNALGTLRTMPRKTPAARYHRSEPGRIPLADRRTPHLAVLPGAQNPATGFGETAGEIVGESQEIAGL